MQRYDNSTVRIGTISLISTIAKGSTSIKCLLNMTSHSFESNFAPGTRLYHPELKTANGLTNYFIFTETTNNVSE